MSASMRVETIGNAELWLGDCREILPTLPKVDAVITDPPYFANTHEGARGKGASTGGSHVLVDFASIDPHDWRAVIEQLVQKSERWVVVFSDWKASAYVEGLPLIRMGVWVKNDPAPQFSGDRPASGWESIAIFHRDGRKRWAGGGRPAVWRTNIEKRGEHPTQKPAVLMDMLVSDFTESGELVLDPFMGGGSTGIACLGNQRRFIGIEREPKYFDIACRRIEDAQRQGRLIA